MILVSDLDGDGDFDRASVKAKTRKARYQEQEDQQYNSPSFGGKRKPSLKLDTTTPRQVTDLLAREEAEVENRLKKAMIIQILMKIMVIISNQDELKSYIKEKLYRF